MHGLAYLGVDSPNARPYLNMCLFSSVFLGLPGGVDSPNARPYLSLSLFYTLLGLAGGRLTLGGSDLSFILLSFCSRHQQHKVPTNGPYNCPPELICWCNLHYVSSRSPSQSSRGPWAPEGSKIGQTPGAGFITLSSIKSAQWGSGQP